MDYTIDGSVVVDYPPEPIKQPLDKKIIEKVNDFFTKKRNDMKEQEIVEESCKILTSKLDAVFSGFPLGKKMTDEIVEYYREHINKVIKERYHKNEENV